MGLDPIIKQTLRKHIARGKLTVSISRRRGSSLTQAVTFDAVIARQYFDASKELAQMLGTFETLSLNVLAQLEGVLTQKETDEDLAAIEPVVVRVLEEAITRLDAMRATEGRQLAGEVRGRIGALRAVLVQIEVRLPELNGMYVERLRARIDELRLDPAVAEERIAVEVAMMADKSDVTEEVVRLKGHLDHMLEVLDAKEPAGRRLDFLSQEVFREVNTLGVKTRDGDVAKLVLDMKAEVEKIREQVQNIE
jgi:uncharacterized protein (TIGR00255 family)